MRRTLKPIKAADAQDPRERYKQRRENARSKKSAAKQDLVDRIKSCERSDDPLEDLFEELVPSEGAAGTEAGELVRAMMKILYRDMNDGDVFYEGYGIETCADAVAYICDKIPKLEGWFENIAMRNFKDDNYTKAIKDVADEVVKYIFDNVENVAVTSKDDYLKYDGEKFVRDNEWIPTYEIDLDLPDSVYMHLEEGDVSRSDIEDEIWNWDVFFHSDEVRITVEAYYVSIEGLDAEAYEDLEERGYQYLEDYGEELDREYGNPVEREDEDEDEYEEDEE